MKMEETTIKIAENISKTRKSKGMSANAVAKAIGRSVDTYYFYEEGQRAIQLPILVQLANLFEVSLDDIIESKATINRAKSINFDCYSDGKKERILIDSQNNDVVFYKEDEWTFRYYVKCLDVRFDHEILVCEQNDNAYPAIVSFDKKINVYSVFNTLTKETKLLKTNKFKKQITILGDYAGTIKKEIQIKDFL